MSTMRHPMHRRTLAQSKVVPPDLNDLDRVLAYLANENDAVDIVDVNADVDIDVTPPSKPQPITIPTAILSSMLDLALFNSFVLMAESWDPLTPTEDDPDRKGGSLPVPDFTISLNSPGLGSFGQDHEGTGPPSSAPVSCLESAGMGADSIKLTDSRSNVRTRRSKALHQSHTVDSFGRDGPGKGIGLRTTDPIPPQPPRIVEEDITVQFLSTTSSSSPNEIATIQTVPTLPEPGGSNEMDITECYYTHLVKHCLWAGFFEDSDSEQELRSNPSGDYHSTTSTTSIYTWPSSKSSSGRASPQIPDEVEEPQPPLSTSTTYTRSLHDTTLERTISLIFERKARENDKSSNNTAAPNFVRRDSFGKVSRKSTLNSILEDSAEIEDSQSGLSQCTDVDYDHPTPLLALEYEENDEGSDFSAVSYPINEYSTFHTNSSTLDLPSCSVSSPAVNMAYPQPQVHLSAIQEHEDEESSPNASVTPDIITRQGKGRGRSGIPTRPLSPMRLSRPKSEESNHLLPLHVFTEVGWSREIPSSPLSEGVSSEANTPIWLAKDVGVVRSGPARITSDAQVLGSEQQHGSLACNRDSFHSCTDSSMIVSPMSPPLSPETTVLGSPSDLRASFGFDQQLLTDLPEKSRDGPTKKGKKSILSCIRSIIKLAKRAFKIRRSQVRAPAKA